MLKNNALSAKQNILMENGQEVRVILGDSRKLLRSWPNIMKTQTALRTSQIAGFVTVPSEKKLNTKSANTFDSVGMIWIVKIK